MKEFLNIKKITQIKLNYIYLLNANMIKQISSKEINMNTVKNNPKCVLLDVRTKEE